MTATGYVFIIEKVGLIVVTVLQKLEKAAGTLPKAQSNVANYIAKNYREAVFLTVEQLSRQVSVSTATVMRLANNMGYSGYTDMINELKQLIIEKNTPYSKFIASIQQNSNSMSNFLESEQRIISRTFEMNDNPNVLAAVDMMARARNVYFTGYRVSYVIASYLFQGTCRIRDNCFIIQPNSVDLLETLRRIGPDDVVFGCIFPRYFSKVPDILKSVQDRGAKTILITDGYNSPAARYADLLLPCLCEIDSFHVSVLGAVFLSDFIIAELSRTDPEKTMQILYETEAIFSEYFGK